MIEDDAIENMVQAKSGIIIDPIKYEIFYNRIQRALGEGKEAVRRISTSLITHEAGEVAEALFLPDGSTAAMAAGILLHVASISRAIKHMIKDKYAEDVGFFDGDQFFNNDPHIGGTHMPDMLVMAPLFYKDELVGWVGNFSHVSEVGAIEPGGICPSATEFYHEGLCVPCVKIVERGRLKRDVLEMMCRRVRNPRPIGIDTKGKIAGNERARARLKKIIDEFGVQFFKAATSKFLDDAEREARAKIRELKPGFYRARFYTDHLTMSQEGLGMCEIEMEVTDRGDIAIRAPVISPARKGYNNCALPTAEGAVFNVMMMQLFYDLRWNEGTLRAINMDVPEGSLLNAGPTSAVALGVIGVGMQAMGALNTCLSEAQFVLGRYDDVLAPCSLAGSPFFGGIDQFGRVCADMTTDSNMGGMGARYARDGADSSFFYPNPWTDCNDVEATEITGPIIYMGRRHLVDSGGFGRMRGGSGLEMLLGVNASKDIRIGTKRYGRKAAAIPGIFGGYPASALRVFLAKETDLKARINGKKPLPHTTSEMMDIFGPKLKELPPTSPAQYLVEGDLIGVRLSGGGGCGDPIERDPALVARDIENRVTSFWAAQNVYCVAIDQSTLKVDHARTEELRQKKRIQRLSSGVPAKKYLKEIVRRRQKREIPEPALALIDEMTAYSEGFRNRLKFEEDFARD